MQYAYAYLFPRYFCRIDDYGVGCKLEFDSVYKQYLAQKIVLNWQFYNQNVVICEETSSTQNNVDETEEQKISTLKKLTPIRKQRRHCKKNCKKKKKIPSVEQKVFKNKFKKKN